MVRPHERRYRIAVDTGGTFSDFVVLDQVTGRLTTAKIPSTPADPGKAVLDGLTYLSVEGEVEAGAVASFVHGTTVATNALLEGKHGRAAMLITSGFRGVMEIKDQARGYGDALFDLDIDRGGPAIPQSLTFEVRERTGADGRVVAPVNMGDVERACEALRERDVSAVAICFLFSFANSQHEEAAAKAVQSLLPGVLVTMSHEVCPRIREYHRWSTTSVNALVSPLVGRYIENLDTQLDKSGIRTNQRYVMQSNGGSSSFPRATRNSVHTVLSGPAGGVVAGGAQGVAAGFPNVVTFDMGGTSCDVCLVQGGQAQEASLLEVGSNPIAIETLDVHTVSAGGGTIAVVDELGALRVGPGSAGAFPGPVCYGRGGTAPTVTDCALVLGYLSPDAALGGSVRLDVEAARAAVKERLADPLGISLETAALGVVEIVNVRMAEAVKAISTNRGFDLGDFALVAFGGAGPMHGPAVAQDLGMPATVIPRAAGVASAVGCLNSPVRRDYVSSRLDRVSGVGTVDVLERFEALRASGAEEFVSEGFGVDELQYEFYVYVRYLGQGYELPVPIEEDRLLALGPKVIREEFNKLHEQLHGHAAIDIEAEIVTYRVSISVETRNVRNSRFTEAHVPGRVVDLSQTRHVVFQGGAYQTPVIQWNTLHGGIAELPGPLVIEDPECTVIVPPEVTLEVLADGALILR